MIQTSNFKTKTIYSERSNPRRDRWDIGLDIGYSAVKGFSPNSVYCFPAFAKKAPERSLSFGAPKDSDIQYRNEKTGEIWKVGESAQSMSSTNDSDLNVFGRARYFNPMFQVIAETGIAMGMLRNRAGIPDGKKLYIQTGLPPEYMSSDAPDLIESLMGEHDFALKIGRKDWVPFHFTLDETNIADVIDQPIGTLCSISVGSNGKLCSDAKRYFSSNVLIMDAGFGTLDIFNIQDGELLTKPQTIDDLGMKRVFKDTIADIMEEYRERKHLKLSDITVTSLQNLLKNGKFRCLERKTRKSFEVDFAEILEKNSKKVCQEAIDQICMTYDGLMDHDYLVITGGTCSAWSQYIREYFSDMKETLTVLSGAQNDNLSAVFANARGYYMYALNKKID